MNRAQETIMKLAARIPEEDTNAKMFLRAMYQAWEGYDDMMYSYPEHQIRAIEKLFSTTLADINEKYNRRPVENVQ